MENIFVFGSQPPTRIKEWKREFEGKRKSKKGRVEEAMRKAALSTRVCLSKQNQYSRCIYIPLSGRRVLPWGRHPRRHARVSFVYPFSIWNTVFPVFLSITRYVITRRRFYSLHCTAFIPVFESTSKTNINFMNLQRIWSTFYNNS